MFIWGCIVGGIIALLIQEARFEKRARDYWETPQGKSKMSKKELAELSNIGQGHIAALRWVQYPSAALLPFEIMLFAWLNNRGKVEEFKQMDIKAYKSLFWRVVSYKTILESNLAESFANNELSQEIENTSNLGVAVVRWGKSTDEWHVSFQDVVERLGGYQDFGEFIEASDYPETMKERVLSTFFKRFNGNE